MARYDDNEMNIRSDVATFLEYGRRRPPANGAAPLRVLLAVARRRRRGGFGHVLGQALRWAVGLAGVFIAGIVIFGFIAGVVTAAGNAAAPGTTTVSVPNARPRAYRAARLHAADRTPSRAVPDNARAASAYVPAEYSVGRLSMPIWIVDRMPHQSLGAVDANFLALMPEGTCVLFERRNINGWRRTVSYDGRYVGYAQIFPTVPYAPQPMQTGFAKLISLLRRIP